MTHGKPAKIFLSNMLKRLREAYMWIYIYIFSGPFLSSETERLDELKLVFIEWNVRVFIVSLAFWSLILFFKLPFTIYMVYSLQTLCVILFKRNCLFTLCFHKLYSQVSSKYIINPAMTVKLRKYKWQRITFNQNKLETMKLSIFVIIHSFSTH